MGASPRVSSRRKVPFTTVSGRPILPLYVPDEPSEGYDESIGYPGQYPFTRGVHAHRCTASRLWTMRQFAGFGTPRQTNERFKFLLDKGQTGLSTAFDLPTLMGLDSDDPRSARRGRPARRRGRYARRHASELFDGIDLADVSVSMTINAPAAIVLAFYPRQRPRTGRRLEQAARHDPERHPQGVPRPERVRLPAASQPCGWSAT